MKKYEYEELRQPWAIKPEQLEQYGNDGWQMTGSLIHQMFGYLYYFMREITELNTITLSSLTGIDAGGNTIYKDGNGGFFKKASTMPQPKQTTEQEVKYRKYYTPDLSEFHVGFEFQIKQVDLNTIPPTEVDCWDDTILHIGFIDSRLFNVLQDFVANKWVRVKLLDEQDILSEGWEFKNYDELGTKYKYYSQDGYALIVRTDNKWVIVDKSNNVLFYGEIKNINELRFQMKRLGIK